MKTVKKHISAVRIGDTVIHDGEQKTVTNTSFKFDGFMGLTLWGDSYRLGYQDVEVIVEFMAKP